MGKAFRVNTITSDLGESERLIEFRPCGEPGEPDDPVISLKPISESRRRDVQRKHTRMVPARNGKGPREETNWDEYQDELASYTIASWKGVVGADDKPLPCVHEAKIALLGSLKAEIILKALQGEVVDTTDSFPAA